jgi:hypothetical protein
MDTISASNEMFEMVIDDALDTVREAQEATAELNAD